MKTFKSILITILCGAAILLAGYTGIIFGGEWVLTNPAEPELVTMRGNASSLFYSRLEDDIQLYPWNYYPQNGEGRTLTEKDMELEGGFFLAYDPELEWEVFYVLIAVAADVRYEEVSQWYDQQQKTIFGSIVKGKMEDRELPLYFYSDIITLEGMDYEVRISCTEAQITSFSCIPCRDEGIKETEEWKENQERLTERLEKHSGEVMEIYLAMYDLYYAVDVAWDYGTYLAIYMDYIRAFGENLLMTDQRESEDMNGEEVEKKKAGEEDEKKKTGEAPMAEIGVDGLEKSIVVDASENEERALNSMQVIELQNSILLVLEEDLTVGLYYDVLDQRIVGFHFLDNYLRL